MRCPENAIRLPQPSQSCPEFRRIAWRWIAFAAALSTSGLTHGENGQDAANVDSTGAERPAAAPTDVPSASPIPASGAQPDEGKAPPPRRQASPALTTCTLEQDEEFIGLDWARRRTFEGVCVSARWLDRLFGDKPLDLNQYPIEGYIGFDLEKSRHEAFLVKPKLRIRMRLPNISDRFDLFFERDDENKTVVGESDSAVTRQLRTDEQNTAQLGLGYEILRGIDSLLSFRAGIRMSGGKPDPFLRSRYNLSFARSERTEWRFGQSLFWRHIEGFGETTTLDYENRIGGPYIFRWNNSATVSQTSDAFRWGSAVSILHPLDERRTLIYTYSASGETGQPDPVSSFGPRLGYRQQLHRRWLFGELYFGANRVKELGVGEREFVPYVGLKIEAHFKPK